MSSGEFLLTLCIAIIVFSPKQLPMLARHLGQAWSFFNRLKFQVQQFWQAQLNEQQLLDNKHKAEQADAIYQHKNPAD